MSNIAGLFAANDSIPFGEILTADKLVDLILARDVTPSNKDSLLIARGMIRHVNSTETELLKARPATYADPKNVYIRKTYDTVAATLAVAIASEIHYRIKNNIRKHPSNSHLFIYNKTFFIFEKGMIDGVEKIIMNLVVNVKRNS